MYYRPTHPTNTPPPPTPAPGPRAAEFHSVLLYDQQFASRMPVCNRITPKWFTRFPANFYGTTTSSLQKVCLQRLYSCNYVRQMTLNS